MKLVRLGAMFALIAACGKSVGAGGGNVTLASAEDTVSYIIGFQIGGTLKQQGAPARPQAFAQGFQDAMYKKASRFTPEQSRSMVMAFQQKHMDSVSGEGEKFLADNAKKEGVKTTPSGLQYKQIREGKGAHPKATNTVTVHYRGTLPSGTAFDSSYGGQPVSFPLNRVISGWTEGVQLMSPGAKDQFWIPSKLAYGEQGSPPAIGPNQPLVFEIELISFK
jgi:FKBP-type peptidyl-prolyl cis-trans isomerase FkpA/FKBP-type peptidyl-prolyl cis-trans isomerase FklB